MSYQQLRRLPCQQAQIRQKSRGISEDIAEAAMAACTLEVPNELDYGLTKRKVIYKAYDGCYPPTPAVEQRLPYEECFYRLDCLVNQLEANSGTIKWAENATLGYCPQDSKAEFDLWMTDKYPADLWTRFPWGGASQGIWVDDPQGPGRLHEH